MAHSEIFRGGRYRVCHNNLYISILMTFTILMIWASFGKSWLGSLYFVKPNVKMNAEMYFEVIEKHLKKSMRMTSCSIFI